MTDWYVTVLSGELPVTNITRFPDEMTARKWVAENADWNQQSGVTGR